MQSSSLNVGEEGPSAEAEEESSSMEVEVVTSEPSAKKISKADACLKREAIDCWGAVGEPFGSEPSWE